MSFLTQMARGGADLLSQATDGDCSLNSLLCDIFEEARGYVKVLLNIQVGCLWRSWPPGTDRTSLTKGCLEIGGIYST